MADVLWKRYGYFDITELTVPQIKLYSQIASNSGERIDLESQLETVMLTRMAHLGDEKNLREFDRKISTALRKNRRERQRRVGYKRKGKILKPA